MILTNADFAHIETLSNKHFGPNSIKIINTMIARIRAQDVEIERLRDDAADTIEGAEAERKNKASKHFNHGYVIAVCNLQHLHSDDVIATDLMLQIGVSLSEIETWDIGSYDMEPLRKLFRDEPRLRGKK